MQAEMQPLRPKSFWQRPEGVTGAIFLLALLIGGGYLFVNILPTLIKLAENTLYLAGLLALLAGLLYVVLDPKMRNLIWFVYKSIMRWITGLFVQIDPISILKSSVESKEESRKYERPDQSVARSDASSK